MSERPIRAPAFRTVCSAMYMRRRRLLLPSHVSGHRRTPLPLLPSSLACVEIGFCVARRRWMEGALVLLLSSLLILRLRRPRSFLGRLDFQGGSTFSFGAVCARSHSTNLKKCPLVRRRRNICVQFRGPCHAPKDVVVVATGRIYGCVQKNLLSYEKRSASKMRLWHFEKCTMTLYYYYHRKVGMPFDFAKFVRTCLQKL